MMRQGSESHGAEEPRRCVRCGAPLPAERERCPRCGMPSAALESAPPLVPGPQGIPVLVYTPTVAGPPIGPEPYVRAERLREGLMALAGLAGAAAPPPAERETLAAPTITGNTRQRRTVYAGLTALLIVLVLAGMVGGVLARVAGVGLPLGPLPFTSTSSPQPTPSPIAAAATGTAAPIVCATATLDPVGKRALLHAQLTTGLLDPETQDFRPVNKVNAFRVGQRAYITFQVATAQAGTVEVLFCTPGGEIPGTLEIPARTAGHYGQFSIPLVTEDVGDGVATLRWNGAVAAALPFSVAPSAARAAARMPMAVGSPDVSPTGHR